MLVLDVAIKNRLCFAIYALQRSPPRYDVKASLREDSRRPTAPQLSAAAPPVNPFYSSYNSRPTEMARPANPGVKMEEEPRRYYEPIRRDYADPRQFPDSRDRYAENPFRGDGG